jgi:hypothetical protein
MKKIIILTFLLIVSITFGQVPSGCGSTNWPSSVTTSAGSSFTVPAGSGTGWTYVWVVTPGLQIVTGQGTTTTVIQGNIGFSSGSVYITRYKNGVSACADVKTITIGNAVLCNYTLSILDEYVDGTQSGSDIVHLSVGGNYPTGTTYAWTITRQDGSVQYYPPQATRVRIVAASINNRITDASVVANFNTCSSVVTKKFTCSIPHSDFYGNLFPECGGSPSLSNTTVTIKVSPNPTSSLIKFDGENLSNYIVSIFNINGTEIIRNSKIDQNISLEKQEKGIYIYIITDENGFKQEGKIVKD